MTSNTSSWRQILNREAPQRDAAASARPVEQSLANKAQSREEEIAEAMNVLSLAGVRIVDSDRIGIWSDLDCPEIRRALATIGMAALPVVHIETARIDTRYKIRWCPDRPQGEAFSIWLKRAETEQIRLLKVRGVTP